MRVVYAFDVTAFASLSAMKYAYLAKKYRVAQEDEQTADGITTIFTTSFLIPTLLLRFRLKGPVREDGQNSLRRKRVH